MAARRGSVYLVGAGPGDPSLLTRRGFALLASADVVLHDELVHRALLQAARADAEIVHVGKRGHAPADKQLKQEAIDRMLVEHARAEKSVVRLKGGDPFLFGRGSEECEALARAGIPFEVVPGVTSPLAVAAYAGISLTHRDLASSVVFVSGTTRRGEAFDFAKLRGLGGTLCILMGLKRIAAITGALVRDAALAPSTPAAAIARGTLPGQRVVVGTLADLAERVASEALPSPALVVVGEVVRLREAIRWFDARPLFGKRVLVLRASHQAGKAAALVRARGAEPVEAPLLDLRGPPEPERVRRAVDDLPSYDLVAFTSENAVARFFDAIAGAGKDARAFGRALVAAVGRETAAALGERGLVADVVPESFVGEALAEACAARLSAGARILLPRAKEAREVFPEAMRARGVTVDVVPVYETVSLAAERGPELAALLERDPVDAVLLTSSSTASALAEALGARAPGLLGGAPVASIGPATTKTAQDLGLSVAVEAAPHTLEGLLDGLETFFATGGGTAALSGKRR